MSSVRKSTCRVRRMRAGDIEQVMAIASELKSAPQWMADVYMGAISRAGVLRRIALVAVDHSSGEVIGFTVSSLLPPEAELESMVVKAGEQRRGIGSLLLDELAAELRAAAVREILLEVRASNYTARAFYDSKGWRQTGQRPRYYADPEEDAILMSLQLG